VCNSDCSVDTSSSSKRDLLSKTSDSIAIEETVETVEGVLVKVTGGGSGESIGVATVVEDGICGEGEGTVGGRDGEEGVTEGETDTVDVREGDEDEE